MQADVTGLAITALQGCSRDKVSEHQAEFAKPMPPWFINLAAGKTQQAIIW
jgi:hypothetical protein